METTKVIRCKDCNDKVELDSLHQCQKTGQAARVQIGADCVDKFYFDLDKANCSELLLD